MVLLLRKCFHFQGESWRGLQLVQVSGNVHIIPLNWVRIYRNLSKNWIPETANKKSKINKNLFPVIEWTDEDNIYDWNIAYFFNALFFQI